MSQKKYPTKSAMSQVAFSELRDKALQALDKNQRANGNFPERQQLEIESLFEELRIYQAELEIQNQTLQLSQMELEQSQSLYQSLFESLPVAALVIDSMGVISEVNEQGSELLEVSKRRHIIDHSIYRYFTQESASWIANQITHHKPVSLVQQQLEIYTGEKGKVVCANLIQLPQEGNPRFILLLVDLSVELAQKEQWLLLESIIDNSSSVIYAFDRQGKCILANKQALNFLDLENTSQALGKTRAELMAQKDAESHYENDGIVFSSKKPITYEETIDVDGAKQYYISNKFPLKSISGEVYAVAGIATNITKERISESRLKIAMQVFSQGQEGIVIADNNKLIMSTNKAFETITAYSEAEVIGKNPKLLASGKHDKTFYKKMWDSVLTKGVWTGEIWNRKKDGEIYPQNLTISIIYDEQNKVSNYIGVFSDISAKKSAEEEIQQLAFYDALTGTANRFLLREIVNQKLREAQRAGGEFSILFLDLDHFKEINDVFGHDLGDEILKEVTQRIKKLIRVQDTLSRIGGDEFVLMLDTVSCEQASIIAQKIVSTLIDPFFINKKQMNLSASVGIASYPVHGQDFESLLKNADVAMYQAKSQGRNNYTIFEDWMLDASRNYVSIDVSLRNAIKANQLKVVFQPQVCFKTQEIIGFEALCRWFDESTGEYISPATFIPVAERSDLIIELSDYVIDKSLSVLAVLASQGLGKYRVSVNISSREFIHADFIERISNHLKNYPELDNRCLELELTERVAMNEPKKVKHVFDQLKTLGVEISLDDFGTGYSSLNILKTLQLKTLKIDMSFVKDVITSKQDAGVCHAIIAMAKALDLDTIVEGVETQEQAEFFTESGADIAQGYWFARPMDQNDLEAWLKHRSKDLI
ncbi:MAG: EAL domain-containing protein [Thiotrichales bacterium]|nr:EAL domain-containing protein [Thiotrichales bacterium]